LITQLIFGRITYHKALFMQSSSVPCYVVPLRPCLCQHPFSNNLSQCASLNVTDQVSHPLKTRCKIILLRYSIFAFLVNE
jgi:hypothetical protein